MKPSLSISWPLLTIVSRLLIEQIFIKHLPFVSHSVSCCAWKTTRALSPPCLHLYPCLRQVSLCLPAQLYFHFPGHVPSSLQGPVSAHFFAYDLSINLCHHAISKWNLFSNSQAQRPILCQYFHSVLSPPVPLKNILTIFKYVVQSVKYIHIVWQKIPKHFHPQN